MTYKKHDELGGSGKGFLIEPEFLAHDLAMAKLNKQPNLNSESSEEDFYNAYIEILHEFNTTVKDKIRYDKDSKEYFTSIS